MTPVRPYSSLASIGPAVGSAIGAHMDAGFRSMARSPCVVSEPRFWRMVTGEPHPMGNMALLSAPTDLTVARAAVEPLASSALPSVVLLPGMEDAPADVNAYLIENGYMRHGALPAMGVDIARMADSRLPPGYEFVRVGEADRDEWARQFAVGYELPLGVAQCFAPYGPADEDGAMQFFAVRKNNGIVATSVCYLADGIAGIYCVSTIASERGKGLGAHATAEPLRIAARSGYGVGVLQSSEAGYPVYKRLGFQDFGGVPLYMRMP